MIKKILLHPLFLILVGIILGVLSKYGDIAYANTFFECFGVLSSGILIWLVFCTLILIFTNEKGRAMLLIVSLMLPMLISYYLFSFFVVKYFSFRVMLFWMLMLVLSLLVTNYIWNIRFCNKFKWLFIIASILAIIYDAFYINGFRFLIMIPEIILAIITLFVINNSLKV